MRGAITGYMDVAQMVLYAFWIFFAGLIYYLRSEDKREGYPMESDRGELVQGFPPVPKQKTFHLRDGRSVTAPSYKREARELQAVPIASFPGAPLMPTGNPMLDGVGPAAWAERHDEPDLTAEGDPKIVPLRVATDFSVAWQDPDPRGMQVVGADGRVAGIVQDVWVDRSEIIMRFLEVALTGPGAEGAVLLPANLARISRRRGVVKVKAITAAQFADVPGLQSGDQITLLEEDRIFGYYGGGYLYADPIRAEPAI